MPGEDAEGNPEEQVSKWQEKQFLLLCASGQQIKTSWEIFMPGEAAVATESKQEQQLLKGYLEAGMESCRLDAGAT